MYTYAGHFELQIARIARQPTHAHAQALRTSVEQFVSFLMFATFAVAVAAPLVLCMGAHCIHTNHKLAL